MGFVKLAKFALVAIVITTFFSSFASAQPFQKPLRWLGNGFSAGYHRCNPGPNVDYYNPWNAHNSMLISQLPQFQNRNFQSFDTSNISGRPIYQGVPFSIYAAPKRQHNYDYQMMHDQYQYEGSSVYQGGHDQYNEPDSVDGSFEAYDASEDEDEAETDFEEDQWDDDDSEWDDDDNEWSDEGDNDDSTRIQAPVPGGSPFSNAGFARPGQTVIEPANVQPLVQPTNQDPNLFNPFPALNPGH